MDSQSHLFILIFALVLIPAVSIADSDIQYHYNVHVADDLSHFKVEICFPTQAPSSNSFTLDNTTQQFTNIHQLTGTQAYPIPIEQQKLDLSRFKKGDCIVYTARFDDNITFPRYKEKQSIQNQILITLSQWLWRPAQQEANPITINYFFPENFEISSPGHLLTASSGKRSYQLAPRLQDWSGRVAVGQFKTVTRYKNNSRIDIAILNSKSDDNKHHILHWVDANLATLYQVYNELPVKDLQLLVVPIGRNQEPVPWGQVMRGGGDAVHVYIDETRPLQEFLDDWVLIHELSHLLHPRLTGNSKWLSEGLASYYQNVLRARSGLLTEKQAWKKMNAGFNRGIKGTSRQQTLLEDSETMMRNRSFMRVYWSGAAISLMADTQLRISSGNKQSLDTVLNKFKACCLPMHRRWSAKEFMLKLDDLSNSRIFSKLYRNHANSRYFPDISNTYSQLSINMDQDDRYFNKTDNFIRSSIMRKNYD